MKELSCRGCKVGQQNFGSLKMNADDQQSKTGSTYLHAALPFKKYAIYIALVIVIFPSLAVSGPCVDRSQCSSNECCELQKQNGVLGYYCLAIGQCNHQAQGIETLKKAEGGVCSKTTNCDSNCCEGGLCRSKDFCITSYLWPFIIVLIIIVVLIILIIMYICIKKCCVKRMKAKKQAKRIDIPDQQQSLVFDEKNDQKRPVYRDDDDDDDDQEQNRDDDGQRNGFREEEEEEDYQDRRMNISQEGSYRQSNGGASYKSNNKINQSQDSYNYQSAGVTRGQRPINEY